MPRGVVSVERSAGAYVLEEYRLRFISTLTARRFAEWLQVYARTWTLSVVVGGVDSQA
jgi:hypothetical protein